MKFTGFMNGCAGKILTVILSVVLGVILTLGGIAGGGYYLLTKKGMLLKAEEFAVSKGAKIDFDDEVAQGTILDWGKLLVATLKDTGNSTIGSIESLIGMSIISNTLNQMLGIEQTILQGSTIKNIGSTISSNLTMGIAEDKFGITFPDMPIFADEEFLAKPLGEAFGSFDDYTLGQVLKIDENSHAALRALQNISIKDIGGEATKQSINGLSLCELMTIDESSSDTLKALKYNTIDSTYRYVEGTEEIMLDENGRYVYETKVLNIDGEEITVEKQGISDKMKELKISEVISITSESNAILRKMRTATEAEMNAILPQDLENYIREYITDLYQNAYPNAFDAVIISDYGGVDQPTVDAMALLQKEQFLYDYLSNNQEDDTYCKSYVQLTSQACGFGSENLLIEQLGGSKFNDLIDNTEMGEVITIGVDSEPILRAFEKTKIKNLNVRIQTLRLDEIFSNESLQTGAMGLIDPSTTLQGIPDAITTSVKDSTISTLKGKGIIAASSFANMSGMKSKQQSFIYNSSISGFLEGVIDFIANPTLGVPPLITINYVAIQFEEKDFGDPSFGSLTDFANAYKQYESLRFGSDVTITVDTDISGDDYRNFYNEELQCFCIPIFSLETETTFNFTDGTNNVDVKLAVYTKDEDNYTFAKHQYAFFYAPDNFALDHISTIEFAVINS